jgi:uncharacterized membrane protein YvbJ
MVYCPKCGIENQEDAEVCKSCGIGLEYAHRTLSRKEEEPSSSIILMGYAFAFLGIMSGGILSIVGFILGLITYRKDTPKARTHGLLIMILSLVIFLVAVWVIFLLLTGSITFTSNATIPRFSP